jgi:hypothetical protein
MIKAIMIRNTLLWLKIRLNFPSQENPRQVNIPEGVKDCRKGRSFDEIVKFFNNEEWNNSPILQATQKYSKRFSLLLHNNACAEKVTVTLKVTVTCYQAISSSQEIT